MAAKKFLRYITGGSEEVFGVQTSSGVANAGDIPALNDSGVFDSSLLPAGTGADASPVQATENITGGAFVNVYDGGSGVFRMRNADASTTGKEATGYCPTSVLSGASGNVFDLGQINSSVTGAVPGPVYLSETVPGGFQATAPTTANHISQKLGYALSSSKIATSLGPVFVLR